MSIQTTETFYRLGKLTTLNLKPEQLVTHSLSKNHDSLSNANCAEDKFMKDINFVDERYDEMLDNETTWGDEIPLALKLLMTSYFRLRDICYRVLRNQNKLLLNR